MPFDSTLVDAFYQSYPDLSKYRSEVKKVYREHNFTQLWYDKKGVVEFGHILYDKVRDLESEGIMAEFPYQDMIDNVFAGSIVRNQLTDIEKELMLTNLYLFYTEKAYEGLDESTSKALGWHLPRKEVSYAALLDSVLDEPELLEEDDSLLYSQFYKLREVLNKHLEIKKNGGWGLIDTSFRSFVPGDTGMIIRQIRDRLFITGELKKNSKSNEYDPELVEAVQKYQQCNGMKVTEKILPRHVKQMNIPVSERILQIVVNMERCRWLPVEFEKAEEYIMVNIPSFTLKLVRDGQSVLESPVVVGDEMTQTIVFSGKMSYLVFSPYWTIPESIVENEIKPEIKKDRKYLKKNNMEWSGKYLRQKPGPDNSLGLVKFMFPNTNDIYLHDTPAKSLFKKENRALSHGCIRVAKARDLAIEILKDDPEWTAEKIDEAMQAGEESTYGLKKKIPVYLVYFTALVDSNGDLHFYNDVYDRDSRLADLLMV